MSPSKAEDILNSWLVGEGKVFDYRGYWFDPEVLVIYRKDEDVFEIEESKSTVREGPWDKRTVSNYLMKDLIIPRDFASPNINYREERTGGCTCGSWRLGPDYPHANNCYKRGWGRGRY